jgi:hypothetical protein
MESIRISEKNRLNNEIRDRVRQIERNEYTVVTLKRTDLSQDYINQQIDKLSEKNKINQQIIEENKKKILSIDNHEMDDTIKKIYKQGRTQTDFNSYTAEKKHVDNIKLKERQTKNLEQINKRNSRARYDHNCSENEIRRYYSYHLKNVETISEHIKKNLSNMPSNKGYVWRGIYCFGELPPENNNTTIMFEKTCRDVMYIHEWTEKEIKLYKKVGQNRKALISTTKRRPLKIATISDLINL